MTDLIPYQQRYIDAVRPALIPEEDRMLVREWLRSKRSAHTRKAYARDITVFYAHTNRKPLRMVTLTDLQDYADALAFVHPELATQSRMLASVKSLMTFGCHRI